MPRRTRTKSRVWISIFIGVLVLLLIGGYLVFVGGGPAKETKPVILYVDYGNKVVNGSGFGQMLGFASSRGFNTVFFQVYRQGSLLFHPSILSGFVAQAHQDNLKLFLSLYITNPTQQLPSSIFSLGEDGVNLDMSNLTSPNQLSYLAALKSGFSGTTAVTEIPPLSFTIKPDILIIETYSPTDSVYIKPGIVASVGAWTTSSLQDYQNQVQYALQNSDGVMVFDYFWMLKLGY